MLPNGATAKRPYAAKLTEQRASRARAGGRTMRGHRRWGWSGVPGVGRTLHGVRCVLDRALVPLRTPAPASKTHARGKLDCWLAIMNAASPVKPARSRRDSRSGTQASRQITRISSGVNTSGISSLTIHGSQVATDRTATPPTNATRRNPRKQHPADQPQYPRREHRLNDDDRPERHRRVQRQHEQ